jgi:hypothetical protein
VETLRCPTCLSGPLAGGEKRCPTCRSRLRSGAHSGAAPRPLLLVERELQARIEAETASGYWQRRRAAKVARRIAALPPTLFRNGVVVDAERDSRASQAEYVSPIIVDLPDSAVRDVTSTSSVGDLRPDDVADVVIEVEVDVEVEVVLEEPAPVEEIEVPAPEVVVEPVVAEPVIEPVAEVVVEPVLAAVVEPVVEVEPEAEEEPVASPEPVAAAVSSRPVNAMWVDRVFNSAQHAPQLATWPRPRTPVAPGTDSGH